jgi:hypothetical protein
MNSKYLKFYLILIIALMNIGISQSNYDHTIINGVKFELFTDTTIYSRGSQDGMQIHEKITNLNNFPISITFIISIKLIMKFIVQVALLIIFLKYFCHFHTHTP